MDEQQYTAEIEVSRKSLFLVLKPITGGQDIILPLAEVKPSSTLCYQYDLWENALDNLDPDEMPIINKAKLESQIQTLLDQITAHRSIPCDCDEDISTRYFRGFKLETKKGQYVLSILVYSNETQSILTFEVNTSPNSIELLKFLIEIIEYGTKHAHYQTFDLIDFSEIVHRGYDIVLSAGEALENWKFELGVDLSKEENSLYKKAERLLQAALDFQENNL